MRLKNGMKVLSLVIILWLISVTFQQTFADLINLNEDSIEVANDGGYEEIPKIIDESEIEDEHEDKMFTFTILPGTLPEEVVDEEKGIFIDEEDNLIVALTFGITEENVDVDIPEDWEYVFEIDEYDNTLMALRCFKWVSQTVN